MTKTKLLYLLPMLVFLFSCEISDPDLSNFELSETIFNDVSNDGAVLPVSITGNAAWRVSSGAIWCKPNVKEGIGTYELELSISANIDELQREATVIVQAGSISKAIQVKQKAGTPSSEYAYKIPIVFHVLYKEKGDRLQYIEEGRLAQVLNVVNRMFTAEGSSVDMNLEFVLAENNPKTGERLKELGVNRVLWETKELDSDEFMSNNEETYTPLLWDPNDYINVFMYNFKSDNGNSITLGISHLPFTTAANFLDGLNETEYEQIALENLTYPHCLSVNSLYIYEQSSNERYSSNDVTVTLAHELGHYLGLHHTFSEGEGGDINLCLDTDYCVDTPTYNRQEYNDFIGALDPYGSYQLDELVRRTACNGETFSSHNIMDYVYTYADQFSNDQRKRIRHVLTYSPLIPGPKKGTTKTNIAPKGILDLPIRTMK